MDKIDTFKIKDMTVSGFKCFREEHRFEFGDITYITGDNHIGKTSIADAITFAFCGRLYNGSAAMDRLYSDGEKQLCVALHLLDAQGKSIDLVRTRKNDKVTITYNGYNIRQKDMDALFGESDIFLSILNPTFFIEYLGNDGQALLQRYLPLIEEETILDQLSKPQRTLLSGKSLLSPETFIANQRESLKEYEEGLIALDGQKALLMTQAKVGKQDLAMLEQRRAALEQQLKDLREKHGQGVNLDQLRQQYTDLLLRIDEMSTDQKEAPTPYDSRLAQLDLNIQRTNEALKETMQKQYVSKYAGEMAKLQHELQFAREEYRKKEAALRHMRAGVECPLCCRPITEEALENTREGINRSMKAIVQQGIDQNTQLAQLRDLDRKAKEVFDQWKTEDIGKHRQHSIEYQEQRTLLLSNFGNSASALAELIQRRKELEEALELGGLTAEEKILLDRLEMDLQAVNIDYEARKAILNRPIPDIDGKAKELETMIRQKEDLIAAAMDYLSVRNDLTFRGLPLDKVGFSLYDILKTTGEVKNTFRFTYNGRDYRKLSHSEKIFAGMEVAELMKALTGRNYPVFVDDSESVVKLAKRPAGQVFLSRVVAGAPLTVAYRDMQPVQELKKAS